ncbi:fluoride export protein 1-like [Prosopis cineraria]|uniref:fluoride export protein 1-like n=1 Tax=Prosopis cineraria TaxID=364024 RepID=UPI00240EC650|nr:fluoride export protein 1-like [Prosopis cineraria]XP_054784153.1 fluoride export protein 1-like [Prosopis cineraria]XP_054784154.1 fluoride export protein 1-like [Prosopis cineraria]XP_054784155.1 fluoride export protein 1-like [Prosopis cineraria]XP_054795094.1 fluoride export protein 1-like [Prosopis cineraria]XP_054795095.1 fluoride export protein 1-like [Prosopis cineraria]XP_054795576.1 fluoride export protein 1-like [Prosopis cineraria]XP_054795577.1 fluoride export protein 1-like 
MERMDSWSSSVSRNSLTLSRRISHHVDDDIESESVSEAGDIGDRALHSRRHSESSSFHMPNSNDRTTATGVIAPIPASNFVSYGMASGQLMNPVSLDEKVGPEDITNESDQELPKILNYASCLIHLAVFGILGVLTRYLLQKLFGPKIAGVTSDQTILYPDLPSNMVGSFLMGWFGVVFKEDISNVSEHLAIALTTGYLGSLTTFSGWNQDMLELGVSGHWLFLVLGFLIGLFLVAFSIIFGVETAKGFKWLLSKLKMGSRSQNHSSTVNWKVAKCTHHLSVMVVLLVMLGLLWGISCALVAMEFKHGGSTAQLWFACMVGPLGVWIRWLLARLNGRGIGRNGLFKWIPFGTLIANVSAACVMAALATLKKSVNNKNCDTVVTGIQFGLLGCLSTVSTFAAEFNAMRESMHPWRAYLYAMITICVSFFFGILLYCTPVWKM